jgi:hypothetical protein
VNNLIDRFTATAAAALAQLATRRAQTRRPGRKRTVVVSVIATLSVGTAAIAYWTVAGSGSTAGASAVAQALTLTPGTTSQQLYPGGRADVALTLSNPNAFTVRVSSLSLDPTLGTGGFTVDGGHTGCGVAALQFDAQSNAGVGWTVPPKVGAVDGALGVDLLNALYMAANAGNACQGATFTVYLTATPDYRASILASSNLVSYWRLGDDPHSADSFTGSAGTALTSHTGEIGASWVHVGGDNTAVLTDEGRVRRNGTGGSRDSVSAVPPSADYAVEADLHVKSNLSGERVGVVGRMSADGGYYYMAQYQQVDNGFHLYKSHSGGFNWLGCWCPGGSASVGQTFRLRLDMSGTTTTTLKVYVDGVLRVSYADSSSPHMAAGTAGLQDGAYGLSANKTDSTGVHVDNFRVVSNTGTAVTDRKGTNNGAFVGAPLLNEPGALAGDFNRAVRGDGSTTYASIPDAGSLDLHPGAFTLEAWIRRLDNGTGMQTIMSKGAGSFRWGFQNNRLGLYQHNVALIAETTTTQTDTTAFHHYVVTKNGSAVKLYVDGVDVTGAVTDQTLTNNSSALTIGSTGGTADFLNGVQDDVAVYNVALSASTVANHYHIGHGS